MLTRHVGPVKTSMRFTRVAWSPAIANSVRVGTITNPDGADLAVVTEAMQEEHRILYRSPCHGHYHFSHYGNLGYNGAKGSTRAFCLEDTNRFHNDEITPLTAEHQSCTFQGIGAGCSSPPGGSFVTEPCTRGQTGPLRSCGFTMLPPLQPAPAGSTVRLSCTTSRPAQVLRFCERSEALATGVACTVADAVANVIVAPGKATQVTFPSPAVRDAVSAGTGGYSLYRAPVLPSLPSAPVLCAPF